MATDEELDAIAIVESLADRGPFATSTAESIRAFCIEPLTDKERESLSLLVSGDRPE